MYSWIAQYITEQYLLYAIIGEWQPQSICIHRHELNASLKRIFLCSHMVYEADSRSDVFGICDYRFFECALTNPNRQQISLCTPLCSNYIA